MAEEEEKKTKKKKKKQQHHQHPPPQNPNPNTQFPSFFSSAGAKKPSASASVSASAAEAQFKASSEVKGLRFGGQFVVRSFTVRRASPLELLRLLDIPAAFLARCASLPFPSTTTYLPTSFTILAHHAWRTLTLGLGTNKSKALVFVFESEAMKAAVDQLWPPLVPLGDVNKKLIRGLTGTDMARFKFRKGCLTLYVYAVRRSGAVGFACADDLRRVLEAVVALKDFLDHTAMLALPTQRSIAFAPPTAVAMAH
ncbi:uncharacterized protein LOC109719515 [Ananas comosus]|uniref:Uncharacterized protein LOC109719515 n=1 Tax=Ananas comosus TaxID=4615 RepID=A0A199W680_ANACO|nr:uncharacterized protein LOC109719515 [Ananas comosus]XP_020101841.1 uncharacterized protein LOC109719515 [Ananas comosus]OAY84756.1 hypothetical protein ACMD2_06855 [Ananas comosus]